MTQLNSRILNILWWCYFVLMALAMVSSWLRIHSVLDAVLAVFGGYGLVGLWGYLRRVAVGWRKFWIVYFIIFVAAALCGVGLIAWVAGVTHSATSYFVLIAAILLCAPHCFALWHYAFRSDPMWQAARVPA